MAIRVQTYDSGPRRIQAGPIDPGAPRGAIRDVRGTAQDSLLADVLAAGKQLTGIAIQEYVKDETTRVSQSLLGMQQELNAERDRYMAENKGQDAIGAGQHFEQFARAAVQRRLQDDKFSGRFAEMFMKQASGAALHFTEQGQAYGRQQKSAWEESVLQGDMEEFRRLVAQNYDNQELIEFNRDALRQRIEGMRPGMDNRALFSRLDSQTADSIIEGYLAHDDISGARGALDKYRDLLGGEVNRVEASIASHARALESRARAEAERARAEAVTNRVGQWIAETKGLAPEERTAELYSRLDGIADMKERAQMAGLVNSELAFEKRRDDAKTAAAVSQFAATVKAENLTPLEARSRLAASGISEEHQEYAMQKAYGEVRENATNRAALDEIRQSIDRKEITDKEQIERAGFNARMTDAQIKEAGKYLEQGGKLKTASISDVSRIYKRMTGKAEMPEGYYDAVISHLQDGKVPTEKEVESIISNFEMQGKVQGDFFGSSLFESWRDDTAARWLPAISSSEERRELTSKLLALGLPNPTETDLRNYKKYRLMGIPFPYGPERQEDF